MTKFAVRLVGEDSSRILDTAGENETVNGLAKHLVERGYLLGKVKTSDRTPEPEEVAILAAQIKWISFAATRQR